MMGAGWTDDGVMWPFAWGPPAGGWMITNTRSETMGASWTRTIAINPAPMALRNVRFDPTPSLFDPDAVQARPLTLDERFERFHAAHPEVYRELRRLAHQARNAGRQRIGMKQLFEVLRWQRMLAGLPDETEGWKLNNSYSSRYARLLMDREPELAGMFEIRELKT